MVRTKGCAVRFLAPRELPRGVTLHSGQRRDAPALPFDLLFTGPPAPRHSPASLCQVTRLPGFICGSGNA